MFQWCYWLTLFTKGAYNPEAYVGSIRTAVENLHASVSRILVNIVIMFDVSPITDMDSSDDFTPFCQSLQMWVLWIQNGTIFYMTYLIRKVLDIARNT